MAFAIYDIASVPILHFDSLSALTTFSHRCHDLRGSFHTEGSDMCCFSQKVDSVNATNIFARPSKEAGQFLVYSMQFKARQDLSMILPIPTPKNSKEDAVQFINLEKYPTLFEDMHSGFPEKKGNWSFGIGVKSPDRPLPVVEVGSFVASFVPSIKDFARLDERFRLPTKVWEGLPLYKDWGFAVFQLKKGEMKVHPMAFEFPRAYPKVLFFPTVHIHDGTVPAKAHFDHYLFCQTESPEKVLSWTESAKPAQAFMTKIDKSLGIVDPKLHVYRREIQGLHDNHDVAIRW